MLCKLFTFLAMFFFAAASSSAATLQFAARQDVQTQAQHLTGLAVADFNGDSHPDLAVTDLYSNLLYIYLNDGTGHFGAPLVTIVPLNGYFGLSYTVSGDVNEDGKQDLIISPIGGNQTDIVLLGNGDGTFTPGPLISATFGFSTARLMDLNGDKHLDLVTGGNVRLSVHLGDGKGNFTDSPLTAFTQPVTGFYTGLAVGDFTGDGHPDFVTGAYSVTDLLSFTGVGDGTFRAPVTINGPSLFGNVGIGLDAADFNGDGKLDVLVGQPDAVFVLSGNGDGTFQTTQAQVYGPALPQISTPNPTYEIALAAAADLDGNQTADMVVADDNTYILSAFLNDGTGKFLQAGPDFQAALDPGTGEIRTADLNGDGLPDIILTNFKTQKISIFLSVIPKTTPSVTIASNAAQALVGSSVTITVAVKGSGAQPPTGTVTLASGSTTYGQQTVSASGQATFSLASLPVGQYALTASYSGDKYNNPASNPSPVTQSITDFQLTLPSSTQSVAVGASATYPVNLTALSNFHGTVALTCSGLPAGFSCSSTQSTVNGPSTTVSLVINPPAMAASLSITPRPDQHRAPVLFALLVCCSFPIGVRRRRVLPTLLLLCTSLTTTALTGCSSSGSKANPYTGTSNFTVTATATQSSTTVTHQATATLTVR